ncbi:MAG: heme-binding protein [Deltaproteobacteria bacterium]|nr:heme-binding protein [Deltaproteobacteria bacterium]MBW2521032.1 heme-binding protein [Deltaproteobacteria bacterium]
MAYEEPHYTVLQSYELFELRKYESTVVAEVHVEGDFDDVGGLAFRKLFNFISNDDRPEGKIAMTAPVIQQPLSSETLPADDSATFSDNQIIPARSYRFAFFMPSGYNVSTLPKPLDQDILVKTVSPRLMAVRSYSGTWSEERYRKNERILLEAIQEAGLQALSPPIFARYNAPFSLWFLRRNEVLVEVARP